MIVESLWFCLIFRRRISVKTRPKTTRRKEIKSRRKANQWKREKVEKRKFKVWKSSTKRRKNVAKICELSIRSDFLRMIKLEKCKITKLMNWEAKSSMSADCSANFSEWKSMNCLSWKFCTKPIGTRRWINIKILLRRPTFDFRDENIFLDE